MECREENCGGEVDVSSDKAVPLRIRTGCPGCSSARTTPTHPCSKCGSLHYDDGSSVATESGGSVFLADGKVVKKTFKPNAPVGEQISIEPI